MNFGFPVEFQEAVFFSFTEIHKELIDQLFKCCALVLVAQDMLDGNWKEKCEVACNTRRTM